VSLLRDNINTIKKNTDTLIAAFEEAGLLVDAEKTKYMLLSRHQNAGQNHTIMVKIAKKKNPYKIWHSSDIWEEQ
jgi:hypothetical protein